MKTIICSLVGLTLAAQAMAVDRMELDARVRQLTSQFTAMQSRSDKAIPADTLRQAKGIILLNRTKAGFIFAYEGGNGAAMVKNASGTWSPVAFVAANEASLGFQIGGEQNFFVILLMDTNATRVLTDAKFGFGGEARGTAGDVSTGAQGIANPTPSILVYSDRKGLYGGAALKGGAITPDDESNRVYYEQYLTMSEILYGGKVHATDAGVALGKAIMDSSQKGPVYSQK